MPIRILHIVQSLNRGGIETMLLNLYRNIDRNIIQFDFVVSCIEKSDYEDEVEKLGGKIFRMPPINLINPYKYLNRLNTFLKLHPYYKIVHSHMNAVSALPLYIAKRRKVPVRISHSHSNSSDGFKGYLKWILRFPVRNFANSYLACSNLAARYLFGERFIQGTNGYLLNNAIQTEKYIFNPEIRLKIRNMYNLDSKLVIGHVGRFVPVKNHSFILDVFKKVHDFNPDTILMLIGDGELRSFIENKTRILKIDNSVILTGNVQNVHDYLQAMDIYIFPSLYEGLGMSLIEAQCSGLKCYAADTVPKASVYTDMVEFISLKQKPTLWAKRILNADKQYLRKNMSTQIKKAGFDIMKTTKWLTDYYLDVYKNN